MVEWIDDLGNRIVLKDCPQRIVSLVPSITLSLFDLGAAEKVVGRTRYCIEPHGLVDEVPIVGGTKKINLKKLLALQPDIVLGNKEENTPDMFRQIQAHVPFWTCDVANLADNERMIHQLGSICQQEEKASALMADIRKSMSTAASTTSLKGKKVLYLIWKQPYMSVGGDTFIHAVLEQLGCINILADESRYPDIDDRMSSLQPDIVLLSTEPYAFTEAHFQEIGTYFPDSQIMLVRGEYFSWFGSMMKDAGDYFARILK